MRFPRRVSSRLSAFVLALVTSSVAILAQAQPDPCGTAVSRPGDVSLQLSLKNGQAVFREGEIIALTAEYSSISEKKYYLATRDYDRSGRLSGMEVFCIDPATGEDPLADYFNAMMGLIGGGLGGEQALSRKPSPINLELNEWRSLPPGSYRLSIVGQRVTGPTDDHLIPLRSNNVAFQVVKADRQWQAAQLVAADRGLDSPDAMGDDAKHAARVLRFLGSEAGTRDLAQRFWSGNDQPFGWDLKFGLFGSSHRATAIGAMRTALTDPHHPVTQEFVQTLATLEMQSDPRRRLPTYDQKNREGWMKARDAYVAAFSKQVADHEGAVTASLPGKIGRARAVSASELLQSDLPLNPAVKVRLRQMLVDSWDSLPVRQQNELIEYRWQEVGGPEWLPILRSAMAGEPNRNHQIVKLDRTWALRRIYELAPNQGRDLILREIASPQGDIGINALGLLPERELPQVEQALMARVRASHSSAVDFQLVERYASPRALPEITSAYGAHRGQWACAPQTAMLRYFLRVSPDYGVAQVSDALGQRTVTGCYQFLLTGLTENIRRPQLEHIAISALDDPSPEVARNSAEALGKYGSGKAEAALWARLEKFHEQWKDIANEPRHWPGENPDVQAERALEQVLVQAIAAGQAWSATEDTIQTLKGLTSLQVQPQLDSALQDIQRGEYGLNLWWPEGTLNYSVGSYSGQGMAALKEKLAQLPPGTRLNLVTTAAERDRHRTEFAEVAEAAAANGLVLQIQTPL